MLLAMYRSLRRIQMVILEHRVNLMWLLVESYEHEKASIK